MQIGFWAVFFYGYTGMGGSGAWCSATTPATPEDETKSHRRQIELLEMLRTGTGIDLTKVVGCGATPHGLG